MWLSWAEWSYNTGYHTDTKMTPYEIVYRQSLPLVSFYDNGTTNVGSSGSDIVGKGSNIGSLKV